MTYYVCGNTWFHHLTAQMVSTIVLCRLREADTSANIGGFAIRSSMFP